MIIGVSREQVVNRLREANFKFSRKTDRIELYRERGGEYRRVGVPLRDILLLETACSILKQAGLNPAQLEEFRSCCVKTNH